MKLPREPRRKARKDSAVVEATTEQPPVSDEEWEALFERSLALPASDLPAKAGVLTPGGASGALEPAAPVESVELRTLADAPAYFGQTLTGGPEGCAEAESQAATDSPVDRETDTRLGVEGEAAEPAPTSPAPDALVARSALEPLAQRVTAVELGDATSDSADGVPSPRQDGRAPVTAVGAGRDLPDFGWRDHDDLVLLGIVLDWCVRGIPLDSRAPAIREAVWGVATRYSGLIGRLEALLPPR